VIGVIVAAHGNLAEALIEAALLVVPEPERVKAVGITKSDDSHGYEVRLRGAIDSFAAPGGVLVLTDMFGGTPSNIGLTMHEPGRVEVLTGANLPMLIRALQLSRKDVELGAVARDVKAYGARAIAVASEVLRGPANKEKSA
jgi:PTS system mannose-specific IIA component